MPSTPIPRRIALLGLPSLFWPGGAAAQAAPPRLADRANAIGERLLGMQAGQGEGAAVSALSLLDALVPLAAGARGEAAGALATLLGRGRLAEPGRLHQGLGTEGALRRAAAVWLPRGAAPLPAYRQALAPFGTGLETIDFTAPDAAGRVNRWVAERTAGLIPDLIDRLPPNASLVITAALHFASRWAQAFDPAESRDGTFTAANGQRRPAAFMRGTRVLPYAETRDWQAIRLAYAAPDVECVVLAPKRGRPAGALAQLLRQRRALPTIAAMAFAPAEVEIALPRLAMSHAANLQPLLRRTTLGPAFTDQASYRGITGAGIRLTAIRQRVVLKLDEAGTEAAAATAIIGSRAMIERARFDADRPFLLLVIHKPTGLHVVSALVNDPGAVR